MKGMYTPTEDGDLLLVFDNSKSLINSKSVQFKVQNLSDTMAEMMAAQDENPLDEDEIEARTVIKKRGRFGTLGKLANKAADKSGLGAATAFAAGKSAAAASAAAEKTSAAAAAATNLEMSRSSLTSLGEGGAGLVKGGVGGGVGLVKGGVGGGVGLVKGVGGGGIGMVKGMGSRAKLLGRGSKGSSQSEREDEDGSSSGAFSAPLPEGVPPQRQPEPDPEQEPEPKPEPEPEPTPAPASAPPSAGPYAAGSRIKVLEPCEIFAELGDADSEDFLDDGDVFSVSSIPSARQTFPSAYRSAAHRSWRVRQAPMGNIGCEWKRWATPVLLAGFCATTRSARDDGHFAQLAARRGPGMAPHQIYATSRGRIIESTLMADSQSRQAAEIASGEHLCMCLHLTAPSLHANAFCWSLMAACRRGCAAPAAVGAPAAPPPPPPAPGGC